MKQVKILVVCITSILSCTSPNPQSIVAVGTISKHAMVSSAHPLASAIGVKIMKNGGNAIDAAIATHLAFAVVYPQAGNIGGGGFMVFRKSDGTTGALDYRERAPINSTSDMYLDENNNIIEGLSMIGGLAVGVPGTIAGVFEAHEKYGSLDIDELIKPVIDLARNGVIVTENQKNRINENRKYMLGFGPFWFYSKKTS